MNLKIIKRFLTIPNRNINEIKKTFGNKNVNQVQNNKFPESMVTSLMHCSCDVTEGKLRFTVCISLDSVSVKCFYTLNVFTEQRW